MSRPHHLRLPSRRCLQVSGQFIANQTLEKLKMNKKPQAPSRPSPAPRPAVPNLPSTTGKKSGDGRGNYPPKKS
jgi:hypothetical protein